MTASLLALLQIADTTFPSGTFTHSFGLEQLVAERRVRTPADLEAFVRSVVLLSVAQSDAAAAAIAWRCAGAYERGGVIDVDRRLFSMKGAGELRLASTAAGRQTLDELSAHAPALQWLWSAVRNNKTPATHAVVLGVAGQSFGIAARDIAVTIMFGAANAILQAGMRLLPVSHRDVQATLHHLRPAIATRAEEALRADTLDSMCSFHPLQEIAAMRHKVAETRMFAS